VFHFTTDMNQLKPIAMS